MGRFLDGCSKHQSQTTKATFQFYNFSHYFSKLHVKIQITSQTFTRYVKTTELYNSWSQGGIISDSSQQSLPWSSCGYLKQPRTKAFLIVSRSPRTRAQRLECIVSYQQTVGSKQPLGMRVMVRIHGFAKHLEDQSYLI